MFRGPLPLRYLLLSGFAAACSSVRAEPPPQKTKADPDINRRFMTSVPDDLAFLESESREVYLHRQAIVKALAIGPGQRVADLGAGTGAHLEPLARAVGPKGRLYAVDVVPKLVAHLQARAETLGLDQVKAVLGTQDATGLPEDASLDLVFTCDTYHHFESPAAINSSVRRALRSGGRYAIVDFERDPETSRAWILDHVRVGKKTVIAEVEAAGFRFLREVEVPGLADNYLILFEAP